MAIQAVAAATQYIGLGSDASIDNIAADLSVSYWITLQAAQSIFGSAVPFWKMLNRLDNAGGGSFDLCKPPGVTWMPLAMPAASHPGLNTEFFFTYTRIGITGRMYVDAVEKVNGVQNGNIHIGLNQNFSVFRRPDGAFEYSSAIMHDLRMYNRGLSVPEIEAIYYAQGNDNITNGLAMRLLMNEEPDGTACAGVDKVLDISGNPNDGTPVNNPTYRAASAKLIVGHLYEDLRFPTSP